jgi:cell division protein FtsZ
MSINLKIPDIRELKPRITVFGVGGAGGNAINNMINAGLQGVDFVVANTDAQALTLSKAERIVQMGVQVTEGLGAGSQPDVGRAAAEEVIDEIRDHLGGPHGVRHGGHGRRHRHRRGGGRQGARELGILTVGVVTKPFHFEGQRRVGASPASSSCSVVDTPSSSRTRTSSAWRTRRPPSRKPSRSPTRCYSGVACITDLMVKLINPTSPACAPSREMGKAMMGPARPRAKRAARRRSRVRTPADRRRSMVRAAC